MQSVCTNCGKTHRHVLSNTWEIICTKCQRPVIDIKRFRENQTPVPDDWSTIQIGTTGMFKNKRFTVTGRLRLQMKNDFRNLWCAQYGDDSIWIGQWLEGIGFFTPPFVDFPGNITDGLRAGIPINFSDNIKVICESIDRCIRLHTEGELSHFPYPDGKFRMVQANNANGNTVLIFVHDNTSIQFLWGATMLVYDVKFENTKKWEGW